ncbi:23S rRNA (guanine(1835)-N(2))-methyltransferase RlmG [Enterobacillus tribolii]|uniref:Ribosomal RNA large subunit methyltransferase G n=1 Tax=Enterobacillus tribolii TaxID=1487935 RepID=A0A370R1B5_9GAMM|nr:23S rRNA (guanine(1835)-N(2))-methyltransferase RlmG [Enterobacillus tribolii]MBW7982716.1 23S rRNA (guanine(1835)-N(2))-methyltransferase RlmG [Enterobacillus tribolii]RDK95722.1 16S rRNA (guanine1207-N2)-methyltransferase [Enterobacillus tribolii]
MGQLELGEKRLELERYPPQAGDESLQAWEAADEYLLQHADTGAVGERPVLLFNDAFGTLACALNGHRVYSISDSYISQLATRHNLRLNGIGQDDVTLLDSLAPLPPAPALVLIKVPKTLALLEHQLHALRDVVAQDTVILAAAKARDIHTSTLQLFESLLGATTTSLAWKKSRLIYCRPEPRTAGEWQPLTRWALDNTDCEISNYPAVFSRSGLDIGARFFMEHLPAGLEGTLADLGCGNGVIGLTALAKNPQAQVLFCDESYMAVASARLNVENNRAQDVSRCEFRVNNSLAGVENDSLRAVLCNPPFHQQHTITDHVAWQMFADARRCLTTGGELYIVGNRHLDYYQKIKKLFGNCVTVASNRKFVILKAVKTARRR